MHSTKRKIPTDYDKNLITTLAQDRLLRMPEVMYLTSLCRATIYNKINDGTFPKQIKLDKQISVWRLADIEKWLKDRANNIPYFTPFNSI